MFLLWPDRPTVHKRRVRIAVKAQSGAPPAAVSAVRVARMPLVHALPVVRASLGPAAVATGFLRRDLSPAPVVKTAPIARAAPVEVRPMTTRPVHAARLASLVVAPSARTAPPSAVRLGPPRTLRRLFARSGPPLFMAEGSPESELVVLLSAATMGAAERAAQALRGLSQEQSRLTRRVGDLALGTTPLDGFWGDSDVADALRLRLCRSRTEAEPKVRWEAFYWWAGRRLGAAEIARMPAHLVPDAAAALVSIHGYRRTFELLAPRLSVPAAEGEVAETAGRLALRCALSGAFSPAMVRCLLPPAGRRSGKPAEVEGAWAPAILALHAYRAAGHEAGLTHVAAAVLATIVRDQVQKTASRTLPDYAPREWGTPPATPEMESAHRRAIYLLGSLLDQLWWTHRRPWPEAWCGPDPIKVERKLTRILGTPAYEIFLDDALAVAAGHALQGHTPSALATLAAARTPDVFVPVRDRLSRALERGAFDAEVAPLVGSTLSREFQGVLERLRHTPDPAEFGSPDWRRDDLRGRLLSRLQKDGPRGLALALRTVLGKTFADLDRFWLAPATPRRAPLAELAAWLDRQAPVVPSERDFILFLESQCPPMSE